MEKALSKAIIYKEANNDIHLKYDIISEISYDGTKKDFITKISEFKSNIGVRKIFSTHDNICYNIVAEIGNNYDKLLLCQVNPVLIVTRYDQAIKITNSTETNDVGIIKIDSVLAEFNVEKTYNFSWFTYISIAIIIGLVIKNKSVYL